MSKKTYHVCGRVSGCCGHKHRSLRSALTCLESGRQPRDRELYERDSNGRSRIIPTHEATELGTGKTRLIVAGK